MDKLLTQKEFADYLGVSVKTVAKLRLNGEVAMCKVAGVYRISESDAQKWYEMHKRTVVVPTRQKPGRKPKVYTPKVEPKGVNRNGVVQWV